MTDTSRKRAEFKRLHQSGCFVMPNCFDAGSARILQSLGFQAIASSSAGFAWSLARPDNGIGLEDALAHLSAVCAATDVPVNADFENGFADEPEGVAVNVVKAAQTGVAGLSIEDQSQHTHALYALPLAVERVRAARQALDAQAPDVLLVARTEGLLGERISLAEAIHRLTALADAGADCLFAPGLREPSDIAAVVRAVAPRPLTLIAPPSLTHSEAQALGVRRLSVGGGLARIAYGAVIEAARQMTEGSFASMASGVSGKKLNDLFGKGVEIR
jgi:2-methylisocitrate lyase-like PEP mutase family enzyme